MLAFARPSSFDGFDIKTSVIQDELFLLLLILKEIKIFPWVPPSIVAPGTGPACLDEIGLATPPSKQPALTFFLQRGACGLAKWHTHLPRKIRGEETRQLPSSLTPTTHGAQGNFCPQISAACQGQKEGLRTNTGGPLPS